MTFLTLPQGTRKLSEAELIFRRMEFRLRLFKTVHENLNTFNVTPEILANRLGQPIEVIRKILHSPDEWTLDTVSDLLYAGCGAVIEWNVKTAPTD